MARAASKVSVSVAKRSRAKAADAAVAPGLSNEAIVNAAREMIADVGVEGLTMRTLSAKLGVALGATYHHVPTKHDLLLRVGEALYAEIADVPVDSAPWDEALKTMMLRVGEVVRRYPGMGSFMIDHADELAATELNRVMTTALHEAGFSERGVAAVMSAMFFYATGMSAAGSAGSARSFEGIDMQKLFEEGLDLLFAGARARLKDEVRAKRRVRRVR